MKLIVITPDTTRNSEVLFVSRMLCEGLDRLHLRKPGFSENDYRSYLRDIDQLHLSRIVIHDYFHLFTEFSLGGVHLNSAARRDEKIAGQISDIDRKHISTSFHSWQEIRDNNAFYSYVFISPVFDSISKQGYRASVELNGAVEARRYCLRTRQYCPDIVGLGGVGPSNLSTLFKNGFDGAAMLGAIWQADDPAKEFSQAREIITALKAG